MTIIKCEIPTVSVLQRRQIDDAYFWDSYRAPRTKPQTSIVEIFFNLFGHHPRWINALLIIRNKLVTICGFDAPTAAQIRDVQAKTHYEVGDTIGPWPIFALSDDELVAGRDNKHLDFRLSILRVDCGGAPSVVVSTICTVHNIGGKIYLFFIVPFHKWGLQRLISRAIRAGRL